MLKIKIKHSDFFSFGPFVLKLTLVLAILMKGLNLEYGENYPAEYEDIDLQFLKSSKSYNFGRNRGHIMVDFFFMFSWPIFNKLCIQSFLKYR